MGQGEGKKNEKENLRTLLTPKNCSNPEHYYSGSWKQDSNLSSFFAQIQAPVFFMSQERTERSPTTEPLSSCPPDLQKMGLTAVRGTTEATYLFGDVGFWFSTLFSGGELPSWYQTLKTHVAALHKQSFLSKYLRF